MQRYVAQVAAAAASSAALAACPKLLLELSIYKIIYNFHPVTTEFRYTISHLPPSPSIHSIEECNNPVNPLHLNSTLLRRVGVAVNTF
jgi:hypothetical protein